MAWNESLGKTLFLVSPLILHACQCNIDNTSTFAIQQVMNGSHNLRSAIAIVYKQTIRIWFHRKKNKRVKLQNVELKWPRALFLWIYVCFNMSVLVKWLYSYLAIGSTHSNWQTLRSLAISFHIIIEHVCCFLCAAWCGVLYRKV